MTVIRIQRKTMALGNGETVDRYVVPAMGLAMGQGMGQSRKMIPNPAGREICIYDTLDEAMAAVRQAGFDYEFEGRTASFLEMAKQRGNGTTSGLEQSIPLLIRRLEDKESSVVANAVYALGNLEASEAIEPLRSLLGHDDADVRKRVSEALAKIGGQEVLSLLSAAYEAARRSSDRNAVHARLAVVTTVLEMAMTGRLDWVEQLLPLTAEALEDESWLVRSQAAMVIAQAAALRSQIELER